MLDREFSDFLAIPNTNASTLRIVRAAMKIGGDESSSIGVQTFPVPAIPFALQQFYSPPPVNTHAINTAIPDTSNMSPRLFFVFQLEKGNNDMFELVGANISLQARQNVLLACSPFVVHVDCRHPVLVLSRD